VPEIMEAFNLLAFFVSAGCAEVSGIKTNLWIATRNTEWKMNETRVFADGYCGVFQKQEVYLIPLGINW